MLSAADAFLDRLGRFSRHLLRMLRQFLGLRDQGVELLAEIGARKLYHFRIGLGGHQLGHQLEGCIAVRACGFDQLEAVARAAFGGCGVGVLKDIRGLLRRALDPLIVFLGLCNALLGEFPEGRTRIGTSNFGISNLGISNFGISKAGAPMATGFGLAFGVGAAVFSAMTVILRLEGN